VAAGAQLQLCAAFVDWLADSLRWLQLQASPQRQGLQMQYWQLHSVFIGIS
jgi:hypothetical protein